MRDYEVVAWLVLSLLGPVVLGLIALATVSHAKKLAVVVYSIGMVTLLATATASVGFNLYVAGIHRSWWDHGPMWWLDVIAGVITLILAIITTGEVLPDLFEG